jgi:hypothetical protein
MDKLDTLVTRHLAERLFQSDRLSELLSSLIARRTEKAIAVERRIAALEREANEADARLRRLYRLVEEGIAEMDATLKGRIATLRSARGVAFGALERAKSSGAQTAQLTPVLIEAFGRTMRENLTTGEIPFRKAYLKSLLERVEVDDREIRIFGRKDVLEQCVIANGAIQVQVRRSVPGWLRG